MAIATLVVGDISDALRVEYDPVEMRGEALFLLDEKVISVAFEFGDQKIGDIHWSIVDTITRTACVHEGIAVLGTSFGDDLEVDSGSVKDDWHFLFDKCQDKKMFPQLPIEIWETILKRHVEGFMSGLNQRMPDGYKERQVEFWIAKLGLLD